MTARQTEAAEQRAERPALLMALGLATEAAERLSPEPEAGPLLEQALEQALALGAWRLAAAEELSSEPRPEAEQGRPRQAASPRQPLPPRQQYRRAVEDWPVAPQRRRHPAS